MGLGDRRMLKRRVCYVTMELRCGDEVLVEASQTFLPREHVSEALACLGDDSGPWRGDDIPVGLRKGSFNRILRMRLPCGKVRQSQSPGDREWDGTASGALRRACVDDAAAVAAKQLGVSLRDVVVDGDSLDEQGKHMAPSGSYPGLITEYHSAIVRGEVHLQDGYGAERWSEMTSVGWCKFNSV